MNVSTNGKNYGNENGSASNMLFIVHFVFPNTPLWQGTS